MLIIHWVILVLVFIALLAFWYFQRYTVKVKRYTVQVNNLPHAFRGFTILQLSDLHSKRFGKQQKDLAGLIRQQSFDLVALTGDFVDKFKRDIVPAVELIECLKDKPVYFVPGNHEWRTGFQDKGKLLGLGVHILDNKSEKIVKGGQYIWVVGVDDPHDGRDRLEEALSGADALSPKVLLAHSPNIYPKAINHKVDLVLAGHTHGGQIRLPFAGAVVAPGQGLFPKWDYGKYKAGATTMIINPGLGESDLPIRVNIRPEIGLITLLPGGEGRKEV